MFALEMTLLTGRYVATAYNNRGSAEWPPHPARLFSAMVATHHAEGCPDSEERAALEWLEQQGAPAIAATEASARDVVTVFVPVNDATVLGSFEAQRQRIDEARFQIDALHDELMAKTEAGADTKACGVLEKKLKKEEKAMEKLEKSLQTQFATAIAPKAKSSDGDLKNAESLFPEHRGRQPRTFPSVTPEEPVVYFQWPDAEPSAEFRASLQRLCERVVRVGHSSSLVRLRIRDEAPAPSWEPDELGTVRLRVPLAGQLQRLEQQFQLHQETQPRVLPSLPQGYRQHHDEVELSAVRSVFEDDWLILQLSWEQRHRGGPQTALPILACARVAEAVRGALQKYCQEPIAEVLSGHLPDGSPSQRPHLAILPLPSVAAAHADGHLMGVALVMPREVPREQRAEVYRAVAAWEANSRRPGSDEECPELSLKLGAAGAWSLRRLEDVSRLATLRSSTWCRNRSGEHVWMSATPVALDRNPGDLLSRDPRKAAKAFAEAEQTIAVACERIGLPRPAQVWATRSAPLAGSEKARRFPRFPANETKPQRVLVHATLRFAEPVVGPILLGAGRYRGLGLFRPMAVDVLGLGDTSRSAWDTSRAAVAPDA